MVGIICSVRALYDPEIQYNILQAPLTVHIVYIYTLLTVFDIVYYATVLK